MDRGGQHRAPGAAGPGDRAPPPTFAAVNFPGVLRDASDAAGAAAMAANVSVFKPDETSFAGAAMELRFVEGVRGVRSRVVRTNERTNVSRASGPSSTKRRKVFVVRAREVAVGGGAGRAGVSIRRRWDGEVIGEVVEEHSFLQPIDVLWPEGTEAWRPSLSSRRPAAATAGGGGGGGGGGAGGDEMPKVAAETVFGQGVLKDFDFTILKPKRRAAETPS